MQSLKFLTAPFCFFLLLIFSSGAAVSQSDTIRHNGQLYARVASASITALKDVNDPYISNRRSVTGIKESSVHVKAVRHFNKRHENVNDEVWLRSSNGFSANFYEGTVLNTVRYNSAGRFIHEMKRYDEQAMPRDIRSMIKPVYYDYSIVVIYEFMDDSFQEPAYFIHLKDDTSYKIVRIYLGEMVVIQSFKTQKPKKGNGPGSYLNSKALSGSQ